MRAALIIGALFVLGCAKTAVSVADAAVEAAIPGILGALRARL